MKIRKKNKQTDNQPDPPVKEAIGQNAPHAAVDDSSQPEKTDVATTDVVAAGSETVTDTKPVILNDKVLTPKQKRIRTALQWIFMSAGIIMMSASVYFFQTPNKFTLGGVAGIAILLSNVIPIEFFSQSVIMAIINVFLLILGLIILGKRCTLKTIYCSLLYTVIIWLLEFTDVLGHINSSISNGLPSNEFGMYTLTDQPFLEMIYAILLFGVGGALVFNCGASSGGTDIIALILKKYTKMNTGVALLIIDLIVVCVSIFTFHSVEIALFSFMGLFAKSFLLDSVIESIGKTKYITIITTKPDEIAHYILDVIQHGYTIYDAEGGYTHEKKKVLITICKRGEALKLKTKVKELDSGAFVIITDANEILGKGFGGTF